MIDLNHLCEVSLANATQRMNNGAHIDTETRKMLKHCATEVVEAMEAYTQFRMNEYSGKTESHLESELADIICCVLIICGKERIDVEEAILDCIEKNRKRAEGTGDKK